MPWIYLSPHLDDVALSCGGLLWEQSQRGIEVGVWTLCAGDPPPGPLSEFSLSLHKRWNTERETLAVRRNEDRIANAILGASTRHFPLPDCIYRKHSQTGAALYASESSLFGELHPEDEIHIREIKPALTSTLPAGCTVVAPLALGHHVDHQLTRIIAESLYTSLWYYADYPYVLEPTAQSQIEALVAQKWNMCTYLVSDKGKKAWIQSVAAHATQISTFWSSQEEMTLAIEKCHASVGGVRLWHPP
ncbi:MAG: PIG-L family deacetylase [Chloroflexota bacterium]